MAEVTAGETTGPQTHYDILDDDDYDPAVDNGPDILMDPHFVSAINHPAFDKLMQQDKYRTQIRPSYEGEKYRFCGVSVGDAHLGILVKTDRIVDLPESVYFTFKEANVLNKDVARRIRAMVNALQTPENAPWGAGQRPDNA